MIPPACIHPQARTHGVPALCKGCPLARQQATEVRPEAGDRSG